MMADAFPSRVLGRGRTLWLSGLVLLVISVGVLLPLGSLPVSGSDGAKGELQSAVEKVWSDARTWQLLGRSLALWTVVTLLATLTGTLEALVYFRSRFRGRGLLLLVSLLPLFVQPVLFGVGLVRFLETGGAAGRWFEWSSGSFGAVLVLWLALRPLVTVCAGAGLRSIPAELEESALLDGGAAPVVLRLSLRLAAPGIALGALLVFLRSSLDAAVPAVFQVKAYAFETFAMLAAYYDEASALAFATPMVAVGAAVGLMAALALGRYAASGLSFTRAPVLLGPGRVRAFGVVLCALWVAPMWALGAWAVTRPLRLVQALAATWSTVWDEIARTLVDSAAAVAAAGLVALVASSAALCGARGLRPATKAVFTIPILVPPVLLGVGMVSFWNQPGWRGEFASTPGMLVLGKAVLLLPVLAWVMVVVLSTIDRSLVEAMVLDGAGWRKLLRHLFFPAVRPHLALLGLAGFLLAFGEFEASTLLSPPGWTPFPVRLFTLLHYGVDDAVAGLALVGFVTTVGFGLAVAWLARGYLLADEGQGSGAV